MMKAYKHILLATNFSQSSETAARKAVGLAGYFNAKVTLLHVVEQCPDDRADLNASSKTIDTTQLVMDKTREQLQQLSKRIEYQGAILIARVSMDAANDVIIQVANEIKADLIVLAAHHKKDPAESAGPTTRAVLDKACCDVLVVNAEMA